MLMHVSFSFLNSPKGESLSWFCELLGQSIGNGPQHMVLWSHLDPVGLIACFLAVAKTPNPTLHNCAWLIVMRLFVLVLSQVALLPTDSTVQLTDTLWTPTSLTLPVVISFNWVLMLSSHAASSELFDNVFPFRLHCNRIWVEFQPAWRFSTCLWRRGLT